MDSVTDWLNEINDAKKREKDFRKDGERILKIYEEGERTPFNILYSNTETLLPAIFSNLPRPVIQRRYKDDDPLGKIASDAGQRMLEYLMDTDSDEYEKFSDALENAVLDGLLPGRGITSIKYTANVIEDEENPAVENEMICPDSRPWNMVYFGYAKKWSDVPWMAYELDLTKDEAKEIFDTEILSQLKFSSEEKKDDEENINKGSIETVCVYQIWDKTDKKVKYITDQYKEGFLKEEDDPLGLTGFFNCPKPITFVRKSNNLLPTPLYNLYENQAKELNRIQQRLNKVIEAIKVRGAYDGNLGSELENIFKEEDNALIPTDKSSTLLNQGGFDKSIWLLPIGELITVARELYSARESCKSVIYEITGISDIVRGQSRASETLGAQKIKETWGTMRLKRLQKEAQRYALDLIKIMLEIAIKEFGPDMWAAITNITLPTEEDKQQAQQLMQQLQTTKQPPPPEVLKNLNSPTWEDILSLLRNDKLRMYRIDIETNSTLDVEATEDKQLIAEFMNSIAQFMNGINPLIERGYMDFDIAKSMMLEIVRRYRFGRDVEDQLASMKAPPKQNPEEQQKKMEEAQKQIQVQQKQVAEASKKLQEQQAKMSEDMRSKTDALNKQAQQLEMDRMKFEFEKKLEAEKNKLINMQKKAEQDINQEKANMELESGAQKVKSDIQKMLDMSQRSVQSMLDKHQAMIKKEEEVGE